MAHVPAGGRDIPPLTATLGRVLMAVPGGGGFGGSGLQRESGLSLPSRQVRENSA